MGKIKQQLEESMMLYPELYNGHADEEFWIQCRKEELLEREGKPAIKLIKKRRFNEKVRSTKRNKNS